VHRNREVYYLLAIWKLFSYESRGRMELSLVFIMSEKFSTGQKINCKMYMIVLVLFAAGKYCRIR